jgi:two-component system sensor histidine kinase/response regulator
MKTGGPKKSFSSFPFFIKKEKANQGIEGKIFHTFCLIAIAGGVVSFFINLYLGVKVLLIISVIIIFVQSFLYYLSRVRGKLNLAIMISSLGLNILFLINYFYNAGINGPSLILFAGTLFFVISVGSNAHASFWFYLNIFIITCLFALEYFNEDLVVVRYNSREELFFDMYFTYLILIMLIYRGTVFLRKSYLEQKRSVAQKATALEKLNTEKDKLFSIISHDLRTPLNNVQQYLEMITHIDLTHDERETIEKDLLNITRNAQDLLTNLLEWSRNQMEGIKVEQQYFTLLPELANTLTHMKLFASKKNVQLKVEIEENCMVLADIDMINLVVRNLLHNAVKFTYSGGLIEFFAKNNEGECLIHVRDNGKGIPEKQKQDIFSLKAVTTFGTNNEKGTGIGLRLCKEYVEMQNGKIWFDSEEHIGTTFYIHLPSEKPFKVGV